MLGGFQTGYFEELRSFFDRFFDRFLDFPRVQWLRESSRRFSEWLREYPKRLEVASIVR